MSTSFHERFSHFHFYYFFFRAKVDIILDETKMSQAYCYGIKS